MDAWMFQNHPADVYVVVKDTNKKVALLSFFSKSRIYLKY